DLGFVKRRRFTTLSEIEPLTLADAEKQKAEEERARLESTLVIEKPKTIVDVFANNYAERINFCQALSAAYASVAEVALSHGAYAEAEGNFRRVLFIREKLYGRHSHELLDDFLNLAGALCLQSKFEQAEVWLSRAITMVERANPYKPQLLAQCMS